MVTPAQETIMYAMLTAFIASGCTASFILRWLGTAEPGAVLFLSVCSFVIAAYLVPNLTAYWLRRPLGDILDEN